MGWVIFITQDIIFAYNLYFRLPFWTFEKNSRRKKLKPQEKTQNLNSKIRRFFQAIALGRAHEWPSGQCVGHSHVAMESFIEL